MNALLFGLSGAAGTACFLWVTGHAVLRRERPGGLPLALLGASLVFLTGSLTVWNTFETAVQPYFRYALVVATVLWTAFVLEYTGRGPAMTRPRLAGLLIAGGLVVGVQWLVVDLLSLGFPYLLAVTASNLLVVSFGGFGLFLVVRAGVTHDDLPAGRALAVAGAGVVVLGIWIVGTVLGEQLGREAVLETVIQAALVGTAGLFVLAERRYGLLESEPSAGHLARDSVFDEMTAAVLVVSTDGRLLDTNEEAERAFEIERSTLGAPLEAAVGSSLQDTDGSVVTLETRNGRREYELRRSPVRDGSRRAVGTVYILRDITNQRTHEQQLSVLNRVLRHNLRNDFDSIRGFAEPVRDGDVEAALAADLGGRIERIAEGVADLGTKVSRIERLLDRETLDRESVDLGAVSRTVADELREEYPGGSIEVTVQRPLVQVRADRELLRAVLEELVRNGLKHGGAEPTVRLDLAANEAVTAAVADDGPGIPEHERAVLLNGEETPLRHGSGIGLWFVYWGVRRLGGTLDFDEAEPRGSVVTLTLPAGEPADGTRTEV